MVPRDEIVELWWCYGEITAVAQSAGCRLLLPKWDRSRGSSSRISRGELAHLVELLMAPLLTSVSSLMVTVMRPMLKAEPLTAHQSGLGESGNAITATNI